MSDGNTDDDTEHVGGGIEEQILKYAKRKNTTYMSALTSMRNKKLITQKQKDQYDLSLPQVQGTEIYLGLIRFGKHSDNEYEWRNRLAQEMGVPLFDLEKDRAKFDKIDLNLGIFRILEAVTGMMMRLEERYSCFITDWRELYHRKVDQMTVISMIMCDLQWHGATQFNVARIENFMTQLSNPKFDLTCVYVSESNSNDNSENSSEDMYVQHPMSRSYERQREAFGFHTLNASKSKWDLLLEGKQVYTDSGICVNHNICTPESHHMKHCKTLWDPAQYAIHAALTHYNLFDKNSKVPVSKDKRLRAHCCDLQT